MSVTTMQPLGHRRRAIAEGYLPVGPYRLTVGARRTRHVRFMLDMVVLAVSGCARRGARARRCAVRPSGIVAAYGA